MQNIKSFANQNQTCQVCFVLCLVIKAIKHKLSANERSSDLFNEMALLAKLENSVLPRLEQEILKFDVMMQHLVHYKHRHKRFFRSVVKRMLKF